MHNADTSHVTVIRSTKRVVTYSTYWRGLYALEYV